MTFFLAFVPIAVILILMVRYRWGASRAGAAGYLTALLIAVVFFGAGAKLLAYAHVKALLLTVDVLLIVWMAFLLFRVVDEAGAIRLIGDALPHLTADRGMQALLIGWIFASFLQGVGGFGVPVAVVAPILVGLGFSPLAAVVIPSVGHSWAVTFGSLGSSFNALMAATNLPFDVLAPDSARFLGVAGIFVGLMVLHAAEGWAAVRRLFVPTLLLGVVMAVGLYLAAVAGLWNVASFLGSLAGLTVAIPLARRYRGQMDDNGHLDRRRVWIAFSGYIVLVAITLAVQLIPSLKTALRSVAVLRVDFPQIVTAQGFVTPAGPGRVIHFLQHAGTILGVSSLLAYLIYRWAGWYSPGAGKRILTGTITRVMSSSVGIAAMVAMAVIMQHAGMTDALARGLADGVGRAFPLASPWIGALGAFMTGSNTNSNVVFAALQQRTAELLGYTVAVILAAQTSGGALGSVVAPTKIVVGASTGGMAGREGEVLRSTLTYTALLVALMSILTWVVL